MNLKKLPLTKRQREIFDYIAAVITEKGYAPSLEEIGISFGLRSLATVHKHLTNLQEKGFITRRYNRSRSMEIVHHVTPDGRCAACGQAMPVGALDSLAKVS